jgi:hypothetical protein
VFWQRAVPFLAGRCGADQPAAVPGTGRAGASRSDPELGGEGDEGDEGKGRYERSVADARALLCELGTPALGQLLTAFHLEQHPELIRVFARAGRALHAARHLR